MLEVTPTVGLWGNPDFSFRVQYDNERFNTDFRPDDNVTRIVDTASPQPKFQKITAGVLMGQTYFARSGGTPPGVLLAAGAIVRVIRQGGWSLPYVA